MGFSEIILERESSTGIAILTLNRPEKLNAITYTMREEVAAAVAAINADKSVRTVIVTGAGRGFCSGMDMSIAANRLTDEQELGKVQPTAITGRLIRDIEVPVIAAINGPAAAEGLGIAYMSDIRLASATAKFVSPYAKIANVPSAEVWYLWRLIGVSRATEFILTGGTIDAAEAERLGLVSRVHAPDELIPAAREVAGRIALGPPEVMRWTKKAVRKGIESSLPETLEFVELARALVRRGAGRGEYQEGVNAFLEKRTAAYQSGGQA